MEIFLSVTLQLLQGFWETVKVFLMTLLFSIPLGFVVCFGSMCRFRPLRWLVRGFIWIIRGTPLMLQLMVIFYGPGLMFGLPAIGRFNAVVVAFSINYACYFAEIYRGGIESVPIGQWEASWALGLHRWQIFFRVIFPQMIKRILAPMSNEVITLVKDTALARVIAVYEVTWAGESFIKGGLVWPLFYTGAFYLLFNGLLTVLFNGMENKMRYIKE